jgi:hypothetical protein
LASKRTLKRQNKTANKAGKAALSKTKKTLKNVARQARLNAEQNEIAYIEKLLGEDFENLTQARRALKDNIIPSRKKLPKHIKISTPKSVKQAKKGILKGLKEGVSKATQAILKPGQKGFIPPSKLSQPHVDVKRTQKVYTIRELRDGDRRKIAAYLDDRLNANALTQQLKQPGEMFVAQVSYRHRGKNGRVVTGYANTYEVYDSLFALFQKLSEYGNKGLKKGSFKSENKRAEWLNQIKIMKWDGSAKQNPVKKGERSHATNTQKKGRK